MFGDSIGISPGRFFQIPESKLAVLVAAGNTTECLEVGMLYTEEVTKCLTSDPTGENLVEGICDLEEVSPAMNMILNLGSMVFAFTAGVVVMCVICWPKLQQV